jgi:hypothetical protein
MTGEGVKLCIHTKMNGKRCQGIALTDRSYCRFHDRYYQRNCITDPDYDVPIFEDSRSIMLGIYELVQSRVKAKVDNRDLTSYMYAYQVAAQLMNRPDAMAPDVAEPFEKAARQKAMGFSSKPQEEEAARKKTRNRYYVTELHIDLIGLLNQGRRAKLAAEQGLPEPEPMPIDRDQILDEYYEWHPEKRAEREKLFPKDSYRRFPPDPLPEEPESEDHELVTE